MKMKSKNIKSERQTTRTIKTDKGDYLEQKIVDKDSGKVKQHTVLDPSGKKVQENITVTNENALLVMTKLLSNIDMRLQRMEKSKPVINQMYMLMLEMNYYMAHLEPEDKRDAGSIKKHFEKMGIQLQKVREAENG